MSTETIAKLYERHAYDPAVTHQDMAPVHVPFDQLTDTTTCEAKITSALEANRRVGVVGVSGSGKSSVLAYTLGPLQENLVPVRVPIILDEGTAATSPTAFADRVIDCILHQTNPAAAAKAEHIATSARQAKSSRRQFKARPSYAGASLELSAELETVAQARKTAPYKTLEIAHDMLQLIADGRTSVIVLDDTDKWITRGQPGATHQTRARFFTDIVRIIAEHFPGTAALAVHENYLTDPAFRDAQGFLEDLVHLPELPSPDSGRQILNRRAEAALGTPSNPDVLTTDALEALFKNYQDQGLRNLRRHYLHPASLALTKAHEVNADSVTADHVTLALADLAE